MLHRNLTTTKAKVVIGCNYQPHSFTRRTPTEYMALRPRLTIDGEYLQSSLLHQPKRRARMAALALLALIATTVAAIITH